MTAKSRRHKLDKKRKSDEHPQPRRREEADRRKEGARSRTGLIPRKREGHDASDESNEYLKAIVEAFNSGKAQLRGISLVPEGQGIPGSFIELVEGVTPLHEVDPNEYNFTGGWPEGSKVYLNDSEKELFDKVHAERAAEIEEGIRTPGSPHAKTAS